ncbi:class I SAM-dependent methyltransferase [Glaciibacter superstes]|uniref:class I SAM-dependent methyltransferase n=1 Tax=Glaciibacter superstes TaxID=501023 RepID=UPI0003B6BE41|nr:class I SAM-dependent methyltransferase [Glaciibacter superstes]
MSSPHSSSAHHTAVPHASHHHDGSIADLLDLDAAVLHEYLSEITGWLQDLASALPVQRVIDLGAGTGTAALAKRFPSSEIVAVDASEEMLGRVRARALVDGHSDRVTTVQLDLEEPWPELGSFEIAWASASLHELTDPDAAFGRVFDVMSPGALFAVVEMDGPPRFLGNDVGDGLESRIHDALRTARTGSDDHPDWTHYLERAGFTLIERRSFSIDMKIEGGSRGSDYAQIYLRRIHPVVAPHLSADDRALFDALVADTGASSLRHRDDLQLRAGRTAWVAQRS